MSGLSGLMMEGDKTAYSFVKELAGFQYELDGRDRIWRLYFPDKEEQWHQLLVKQYDDAFYILPAERDLPDLKVVPESSVETMDSFGRFAAHPSDQDPKESWHPILEVARAWLMRVAKDWIKANKLVQNDFPLEQRYGIVPHVLVRASLKDWFRIDKEIGESACSRFISLEEDGYFLDEGNYVVESMSAGEYFEYCRIAYIASKSREDPVDETLTGRQMYEKYADGRHDGLLDIDGDSPDEFADWLDGQHPARTSGGHPWEIKRGGNTTHIDLSVYSPMRGNRQGYRIELRGESFTRLAETVKMFLAMVDAGKPIGIVDPEGIRLRLLAQDNIGIVPEFDTLHRASQRFPKHQNVYDVTHYRSFGRYKRRLNPFISWEPLAVLCPRKMVESR